MPANIGARLRLSPKTPGNSPQAFGTGKTSAIAPRGFARRKTTAIDAGSDISAPPSLRTLVSADRNARTRWQNHIGPTPCRWASRPAVPAAKTNAISRPSFRYAPASGSRGIMSSRWRDDARARVQTPRQNPRASRLRCHAGMLPGHYTTHIVRDPPVIYSGRTGNPETLCWK